MLRATEKITAQNAAVVYIEYADMQDIFGAIARWAASAELEQSEAEQALDPVEILEDYPLY